MARLPLNKATLSRKKRDLATYQRFLPSLDLKRKQLLAERNKARTDLAGIQQQRAELRDAIGRDIPMLANQGVDLARLVAVRDIKIGEANIVGVRVPTFDDITLETRAYGLLAKPHWVDRTVERLREALTLQVREQVAQERLRRLQDGLVKVTQRVNLFEKVLIPRTQNEIRDIDIALQDTERAAVVRAKVAKRKAAGVHTA
jgi:V/A-type H+-transporting ATPase subunit D